MATLHIVINGAAAHLPFLPDVLEAHARQEAIGSKLAIYLVDPLFDPLVMKGELGDALAEMGESVLVFPGIVEQFVKEAGKDLLDTEENVIFVDYTAVPRSLVRSLKVPESAKESVLKYDYVEATYIGIMGRLCTGNFENRWYLAPTGKMGISELVDSHTHSRLSKPYNLFVGEKMPEMPSKERAVVVKIIRDLCATASAFSECGFLEGRVGPKIPKDWQMNLDSRANQLFINHFELYPVAPDKEKHKTYEFGHNPQYRQVVALGIIQCVSAWILANTAMTPEKARENGGWANPALLAHFAKE
jgi:hypothetical protein